MVYRSLYIEGSGPEIIFNFPDEATCSVWQQEVRRIKFMAEGVWGSLKDKNFDFNCLTLKEKQHATDFLQLIQQVQNRGFGLPPSVLRSRNDLHVLMWKARNDRTCMCTIKKQA